MKYYCRQITEETEGRVCGRVQVESPIDTQVYRRESSGYPKLDMQILKLAHAEYTAQGHRQSLERIQERGGFGVLEVIALLADRCERLGVTDD